jgi:hypothetical protein
MLARARALSLTPSSDPDPPRAHGHCCLVRFRCRAAAVRSRGGAQTRQACSRSTFRGRVRSRSCGWPSSMRGDTARRASRATSSAGRRRWASVERPRRAVTDRKEGSEWTQVGARRLAVRLQRLAAVREGGVFLLQWAAAGLRPDTTNCHHSTTGCC